MKRSFFREHSIIIIISLYSNYYYTVFIHYILFIGYAMSPRRDECTRHCRSPPVIIVIVTIVVVVIVVGIDDDGSGVLPPFRCSGGGSSGGGVVIRSGGFVSISRGAVMVMSHQ